MADLERIKKKYDTPEIDIEEATNGGNRYSLPYGLCKSVGINTEGMTPREAWEAWQNKTGKTKAEAEREHWGKTADEKQPQNENSKENTSENIIKRKEDIKTKDDLISYIKHRHGVELKNENIPFLNDNEKRLYTEIPQENRNAILNDLKQQGFSVEEHNKGYYWIDLPTAQDKKNEVKKNKQETKEEETKSREEAINKMLESDRIKETRTFKKGRIKENLSYGTEEMQSTTANLFNDDSFLYENDKKKGTYFSPLGNRVQYKMPNDGGEGSAYSKGGAFYHETWHAIDRNYGDNDYLSKTYTLSDGKTMQETVFRETLTVDWTKVKEEVEQDRNNFLKETGYTAERAEEIKNKFKAKVKEWYNLPTPHPQYDKWIESTEEYKESLKYSNAVTEAENHLKRKWGDLSDIYSGFRLNNWGLVGMAHGPSYWNLSNRAIEAFAECASAKATNPESYAVLGKYVPNVVKGFEEIYESLKSGRIKANARN